MQSYTERHCQENSYFHTFTVKFKVHYYTSKFILLVAQFQKRRKRKTDKTKYVVLTLFIVLEGMLHVHMGQPLSLNGSLPNCTLMCTLIYLLSLPISQSLLRTLSHVCILWSSVMRIRMWWSFGHHNENYDNHTRELEFYSIHSL